VTVPEILPSDGFCLAESVVLEEDCVIDVPEVFACPVEGRLDWQSAAWGMANGITSRLDKSRRLQ
jgi:hypothetical protein